MTAGKRISIRKLPASGDIPYIIQYAVPQALPLFHHNHFMFTARRKFNPKPLLAT
jgi:hypothetical protein